MRLALLPTITLPAALLALGLTPGIARAQDRPGLASGILEQTDLARQAVTARDRTAAAQHVNQALANARAIRDQSNPGTGRILVPVHREIETTTTYTPVKHGKGVLTAKRMKHNTSIREVQGNVTTQALDVTAATPRLEAASAAIQDGDWNRADSELAAVRQDVIPEQVHGEMPLLKTRENLQLARARILDNKYKDASVPLRAAAEGLKAFAGETEGPQAQQAEYMRRQIEDYSHTIRQHPPDAVSRIDLWLKPVNDWLAGQP